MQYFVPLVAFLGLFLGMFLKKWIPEEVVASERYRFYLEKFLLLSLFGYLLYISSFGSLLSFVFFALGFVLGLFVREVYLFFGFALLSLDFVVAVLVFLYGLSYGKKKFLPSALFFFSPFLLLLFFSSVEFFLWFAIGGLLSLLVVREKHKAY